MTPKSTDRVRHSEPVDSLPSMLITSLVTGIARQRTLAERAIAQVTDAEFFAPLGEDGNSMAILVKHVGGNLRSRFREFLTSDGEKPDRHRDGEFEIGPADNRDHLMKWWAEGWEYLESAVESLDAGALVGTITIRGEPYSVVEALLRAHDHIGYHIGQIVQIARHRRGESWQTLSIARGASQAFADDVRAGQVSQRVVAAPTNESS